MNFFEFVNENFSNIGKEYDSNHYFFRGQSDYSWALEPGIRRGVNKKMEIISELAFLKNDISVNLLSINLLSKYESIRNKYDNADNLSINIVSWIDHGFMVLPSKDEYKKFKKEALEYLKTKNGIDKDYILAE